MAQSRIMVRITTVAPGSRADRHGVMPGDELNTINGRPVTDVLDYRFFLTDTQVVLGLVRNGEPLEITIRKREYDTILKWFATDFELF